MSASSTPTIRELAGALDLSTCTVSLALRNDPTISAPTRLRVQEFAREKGYHLNPFLSSLMSRVRSSQPAQYRETLAWLNLWGTRDDLTQSRTSRFPEYLRNLWQGASQRAGELGFQLDPFWLAEPGMTGRRLTAILLARGIRGILVPPLPRSCGHVTLDWNKFTAVALSYTVTCPQLNRVAPDHHHNMLVVLRTLRHRGYKRIGLILPVRYDERTENRFRSAFAFFQQNVPAAVRIPILTTKDEEFDRSATQWLKKHQPEVVITTGGYRRIKEFAGTSSLGVVLLGYASTDAGYASIDENPMAIGAAGTDQLLGQLNRNDRGIPETPLNVLVPGIWVEGTSIAPPR